MTCMKRMLDLGLKNNYQSWYLLLYGIF